MENSLFLQSLITLNQEEGRNYIQAHSTELMDLTAIANLLADEALDLLSTPFRSLKLAELLIFFGTHTQHLLSHALGLKAKGDVLTQIGHYQAAMECLDESAQEFLHLDDEENWARSRISWIVAAASLGRIEEALQQCALAHAVFLRLQAPFWACKIDHNTAWIYKQVGRYRDACDLYEKILAIYPTLTDQDEASITRAIAMAKVSQAISFAWLGAFDQAYRLQQEAQLSFAALKDMGMVANAEINLADLDYAQGYYGSALRSYYRAQDSFLQHHVDNPRIVAEIKQQIARTLVKLNRPNDACQLALEAVEMYRELDASLYATDTLREYATTLVASRRLKEALAVLDEAQALFERDGFDHYVSATRLQRAELLLAMGNASEAYLAAYAIKITFDEQGLAALSVHAGLVIVGSLLEKAQQEKEQRIILLREAMSYCRAVIAQARQHAMQEDLYKSQYLLGKLLAQQGNTAMAARYYTAAIAQIERILHDLVYDLSPSFLQTAWAVYAAMIAVCLQQEQPERAFNYLERARSMALRQYLNMSKVAPERRQKQRERRIFSDENTTSAILLRTQDQLKTWQEQYRDYSVLLTQLDTSISPTVDREIIETELRRCETKVNELFERLYLQQFTAKSTPHVRDRQKSQGAFLDATQLRQLLAPEQLVLAYFLDAGRIVIFAATSEGLVTYQHPAGAQQLQHLLPFLHAHLQPGGWADPQQPPQQGVRQMLKKLYDLLIAPVATLLPAASGYVTIIPYGPLHTVPFHALYDGSHFLVERFQVSYLPAASMLTQFASSTAHRTTGNALSTLQPPLVLGYSGNGHLQRAIEEAQTLSVMLGGRCYLENEATIARLSEQAPGSPIIHLATHGQSRLDAPNFSSVLLADGRFTAIDAFNLDLKTCELVTLSGCETGLALSSGGDEQLGLGRAFMAAGARSLVMSLWSVEDAATSELMQLFYQRLLLGATKIQALRAAQCALLHHTTSLHTHPYYWAAFRLVGEVGPLQVREIQAEKIAFPASQA